MRCESDGLSRKNTQVLSDLGAGIRFESTGIARINEKDNTTKGQSITPTVSNACEVSVCIDASAINHIDTINVIEKKQLVVQFLVDPMIF